MKRVVFWMLFAMVTYFVWGQETNLNSDARARIVMYAKLNPELFNVKVNSPEAKAAVQLITESFEQLQIIPSMSLDYIKDANEKSEIIALQTRLRNLINNPPTWDQLYRVQYERMTAPPTPPVYAGDEKAQAYYNAKYANKNKTSMGIKGVQITSETSITPPPPQRPKVD